MKVAIDKEAKRMMKHKKSSQNIKKKQIENKKSKVQLIKTKNGIITKQIKIQ